MGCCGGGGGSGAFGSGFESDRTRLRSDVVRPSLSGIPDVPVRDISDS